MGINVRPMGRLRKDFKRIENENERRAKEDRKSSKKKKNK